MTLCVGLVEDGRCIMGADSCAIDDRDQRWQLAEPKCWVMGGMVWADAGPSKPAQVLRRDGWCPKWGEGDPRAWVEQTLTPAIRKRLWGVYVEDEQKEHEILIGVAGQFAVIYPETWEAIWVAEPPAIGNSDAVAAARGVLHATSQRWCDGIHGLDGEAKITLALEAGSLVSPYVSGPWSFVRG